MRTPVVLFSPIPASLPWHSLRWLTEAMKVRDMLKRLREDGWYLLRHKGSHRQFIHPIKPGVVTIAGQPSQELHPKTLASVLKQAGLK
jgi:predicted RNA binding protein YcfA (HicA-like mRNA interferase family)